MLVCCVRQGEKWIHRKMFSRPNSSPWSTSVEVTAALKKKKLECQFKIIIVHNANDTSQPNVAHVLMSTFAKCFMFRLVIYTAFIVIVIFDDEMKRIASFLYCYFFYIDFLLISTWRVSHREWNQGPWSHPMQRVRLQNHVQEKDKKMYPWPQQIHSL